MKLRRGLAVTALVVTGVIVLAGALAMRAAGQSIKAVADLIFQRLKDAHASVATADIVVDVKEECPGQVRVSAWSRHDDRRVDSVGALSTLAPNEVAHPTVAIIVTTAGDALHPTSHEVEAAVSDVRRTLAQRGAILPPLGYTMRITRESGRPTMSCS